MLKDSPGRKPIKCKHDDIVTVHGYNTLLLSQPDLCLCCCVQSEQDANLMELAGDDIDVPEELLKMVDEDATEEEEKDSILGQIQNLQNMDMDQIKEKASATMVEMKSKAEEKCCVM